LVVAGVLNGTFAVPLKRTRVWKFHHAWGLFSILAMVVAPWAGILEYIPWIRSAFLEPATVVDGAYALPQQPGAGTTPCPDAWHRFQRPLC
jgi:hypothetical protein